MSQKNPHGGSGRGQGRKTTEAGHLHQVQVRYLDDDELAAVMALTPRERVLGMMDFLSKQKGNLKDEQHSM